MASGVHGWTAEYFVKALGWTESEVEVYLARVRTALSDKSVHGYYKVYVEVLLGLGSVANMCGRWVVHGRKPYPNEPQSTTPKPSHWPQEPDSDDERDDDDEDDDKAEHV